MWSNMVDFQHFRFGFRPFGIRALCILFGIVSSIRVAALTPDDEAVMIGALEQQRADSNAAHDVIGAVVNNDAYTIGDWTDFYSRYYSTNLLNDSIRNGQIWLDPHNGSASVANSLKQQLGYYAVATNRIEQLFSDHPENPGAWLAGLPVEKLNDLVAFNEILWTIAQNPTNGFDSDTRVARWIEGLMVIWPQWFGGNRFIDNISQPYVAGLRAQLHFTLRDSLPNDTNTWLRIATDLSMKGARRDLMVRHGVQTEDNRFANEIDLQLILDYFDGEPSHLPIPRGILWRDATGIGAATYMPTVAIQNWIDLWSNHFGNNRQVVPITELGAIGYEGFAAQIMTSQGYVEESWLSSHGFDSRIRTLITEAGTDPANWLDETASGQTDPNYFQQGLNFFCRYDTLRAFDSALAKFRLDSRYQPLAQFLYYLDYSSANGLIARGSAITIAGRMTNYDIAITRDGVGRISTFDLDGTTWKVGYFTATHPNSIKSVSARPFNLTTIGAVGTNVTLVFSDFVSPTTALVASHYLVNGVAPTRVRLGRDFKSVNLSLSDLPTFPLIASASGAARF